MAGIFVRNIEKTSIGEMQIVLGRALFSALTIGIIIIFKDIKLFKIKPADIWIFACSGLFSIVLFNYSYYTTMSVTSLSVAAVLLYTAPFFVMIMSLFIFRERLTFKKVFALIIAFAGCCFVSGLFDSAHRISGKALFFGLLTGFGYALYTIFGELALKRGYNTFTITFYVFLFAALGTLPFVNIKNTVLLLYNEPKALEILFLMAIFNTVIPYLLYTTGLLGVEPSSAPIIATVEPVVATLVGCLIYNENITLLGILGILLVLGSVIVLNLKSEGVKIRAYAKINVGLDIAGKRDDGYHTIDTVMQSISLFDEITVKKADNITVECDNSQIENEKNIAYKAAKLFFEATEIKNGAEIIIKKYIPLAAGIGGGSADAAGVLLALDRIYKTDLGDDKLCEIAVKLGADVPFFIKGGTQRSQGIGEILTPLKGLKKGTFLLVKQGNKPSTGEMYKRLDSEDHPHPDMDGVVKAIENNDLSEIVKTAGNSFAAVNNEFKLKECMLRSGALGVLLSGSGPTNYGIFDDYTKALTVYNQLKKEKIDCYIASPVNCGIEFE